MYMRKYIYLLLIALVAPMFFVSCMDDKEEVEYSEDCYIQSF